MLQTQNAKKQGKGQFSGQYDNTSLIVTGKFCGRVDIVKYCRIGDTRTKFIVETAGGDSMPVLGIHEAEVKHHVVFVT